MKKIFIRILFTALFLLVSISPMPANAAQPVSFVDLPLQATVGELSHVIIEAADGTVVDVELYINDIKHTGEAENSGTLYTFSDFENTVGEMKFTALAYTSSGEYARITRFVDMAIDIVEPVVPLLDMESGIELAGLTTNYHGYTTDWVSVPTNSGSANKALKILRPAGITITNQPLIASFMTNPAILQGISFDVYFPSEISSGSGNSGPFFNIQLRTASDYATQIICRKSGAVVMGGNTFQDVFETDSWHNVRCEFDPNTNSYRLYVDEQPITPDGGYTCVPSATVTNFRIQNGLPVEGDYIYYDNITSYQVSAQKVLDVTTGGDGAISLTLNSDLAIGDGALELYLKGNSVPASFSYDKTTRTVTIRPQKPLISSLEYKIAGTGMKTASGISLNCNFVKYFTSESEDFDVVSVQFEGSRTKIGVRAEIQNNTNQDETIVMVMVFKNTNGAVEKVYSSDVITLSAQTSQELSIPPAENENMKAEAFFLKNWTGSICAKSCIYKQ